MVHTKKEETLRRPMEAPEKTKKRMLPYGFNILTEVFIVPWYEITKALLGMDYESICGLILRRTTSPPTKTETSFSSE